MVFQNCGSVGTNWEGAGCKSLMLKLQKSYFCLVENGLFFSLKKLLVKCDLNNFFSKIKKNKKKSNLLFHKLKLTYVRIKKVYI